MTLLRRFRNVVGTKADVEIEDPNVVGSPAEKDAAHFADEIIPKDEEKPSEDAQNGVEKIEAVTLAWSRSSLYLVLILRQLGKRRLHSHGESARSLGPRRRLPTYDVLAVLGIIVVASSQNLPTYCAGYVFYAVGFNGLAYSWDVLAADVTDLRNRGLAFAFTSSPALISAFAGPNIAAEFIAKVNWRWGYGCWAVVAKKQGIIADKGTGRKMNRQNVLWFITEFDLPGVFLFAGGLVVFLLPFTLARTAPQGWSTPYIIAMIVVGFVVLAMFALWECYAAPVPFMSQKFLADRTILGACLLNMTYQVSYYCYASYLQPFLMVVYNVDLQTAGYVANTFSACAFLFLFVTGWLVRWTGRFKWILWICVPLYIFGLGLMIHFRQPGGYIGYIVMCEVFFSAAGSVFILCCQLAVLSVVDHQHVASAFSLLFSMGGIGGALGSAISGAIWTNTFYPQLEQNLPASDLPNLLTIYSTYTAQLEYPWGSPTRDAIVKSYGYAQTRMLAAGTAFMVLGFIWVGMIKNINVKKMSQTKGNVL
ncbi:Siderophore iron transporter mirB [Beauveria bassiana]|uniref:Siderophore iron transporter mirB n=1 Tax=Beauveria bassiana TaxID=176275 RepID=A0A2N6P065_BEABA|nr:Siderophore iron transporter mirB [Beauveria bassiana]